MPEPISTRRLDLPPARAPRRQHHDLVGKTKFTSTKRWAKVRLAHLQAHPLCSDCQAQGRTTAALEVHHILKRADDPTRESWYDPDNLMSLCRPCHSRRTKRGE